MIRDCGVLNLYHPPEAAGDGDLPSGTETKYHSAWYAEKSVGMSRYYAAQQIDTQIDKIVRIEKPRTSVVFADDIAKLADGYKYRVVQSQELFDEDAGEAVLDLSLERVGKIYENN